MRCCETCGRPLTLSRVEYAAEYRVWWQMLQRCEDPAASNYEWYGAKGIQVCDRWQVFECFVEDMGRRPDGLTLDRIDPAGNYEPSNCRWATAIEQGRNKTNTRRVTAHGRTQLLLEWSEETGIPYQTIWFRLRRGWSPERAVSVGARSAA